MRKTTLKRKSKSVTRIVQDELWDLCKKIIRKKYGNVCYSCGKTGLIGSDWQTGHFIPDAACGAYLRYNLRNLRPQCMHCNINLGGNGASYYRNMVSREGQDYVDRLFKEKNQVSVKAIDHYMSLIPQYKNILYDLEKNT